MKKRIFALTLVLAMAAAFVIPAIGADEGYTPGDIDFGQWIAKGSFTSYAFATTETAKLSWKDIPDNALALDGTFDISKIVKASGFLVLTTNKATAATNAGAAKEASATSVVLPVSGVAAKPGKVTVEYNGTADEDGNNTLKFTGADGLEWAGINAKVGWLDYATTTSVDAGSPKVLGYKQDLWFRAPAATETGLPSVPVKVSIAAAPAGPKAALNVQKGEIKVKGGWEFSTGTSLVEPDGPGGKLNDAAKVITFGSETSLTGANPTLASDVDVIELRAPATAKKPASAWTTVNLAVKSQDTPDTGDFALAAKGEVLVVGGKVIEFQDGDKAKKAKKFTSAQVTAGIKVRVAGTKTTLPSEWVTLKWNAAEKELDID
ncbi:MAG: hypothetical protein FWH06_00775 [Oscillospiraceae bacterium]|nr:hypothetical protein [Oscillospiraceae bacterium]